VCSGLPTQPFATEAAIPLLGVQDSGVEPTGRFPVGFVGYAYDNWLRCKVYSPFGKNATPYLAAAFQIEKLAKAR
jgi:hypothetical protein